MLPNINNGESGASARAKINAGLNVARESLVADRIYYVATTGSNGNDGLTIGTPFRTIQHALDVVTQQIFLNGFQCNIQIADGTYDEFLLLGEFPTTFPTGTAQSDSPIHIKGNSSVNDAVKIAPTGAFPGLVNEFGVININGGQYYFEHLMVDASNVVDADCDEFFCLNNTTFLFADNIVHGGAKGLGAVYDAGGGSILEIIAAQEVRGNTGYYGLIYCIENCEIGFSTVVWTFTVDPLITGPLIEITGASVLVDFYGPTTFGGSVTGKKFNVQQASSIQLPGDINYIPGTVAGTIDSSSQYNGIRGGESSTVALLPSVSNVPIGTRSFVTDSDATLAAGLGNIVAHTVGANKVPVYSDGTNWRIG